MNRHTSRIPFERDSSYTCQFCTKVVVASRLVSQVWAKYKDELPMCQVPVKILKRDAKANSRKQSLEICISKKR